MKQTKQKEKPKPEEKAEPKKAEPTWDDNATFKQKKAEFIGKIPADLKKTEPSANRPEDIKKTEVKTEPKKEETINKDGERELVIYDFVDANLVMMLSDMIFPNLIKMVWARFDKDAKRVDTQKLELDEKQRERLEPSAEKVAEWINSKVRINPLLGYIVFTFINYIFAFRFALAEIKDRKKTVKTENTKDETEDIKHEEVK